MYNITTNIQTNNNNVPSKWTKHPTTLVIGRYSFCAVPIDDHRLIITGGYGGSALSSVELFDSREDDIKTISLQDMNRERAGHSSILIKGFLYVVGGFGDGDYPLNSMERMKIDNVNNPSSWENLQDMNETRVYFAAVGHNNLIYVFGGWRDGCDAVATAEKYNVSSGTWEYIKPMKQRRIRHSAIVIASKVYVFGGQNDDKEFLSSMEIFDLETQEWEQTNNLAKIEMPFSLCDMRAIQINKWIVVINGVKNNDINNINQDILLFDSENYKWQVFTDITTRISREDFAAAVLERDKIFLFGGYKNNNRFNLIEFSTFEDLTIPFTAPQSQVVAIRDSPNQFADRLGYSAFVDPLVLMAQQVEGLNKSLCISLNAPWGCGKSFTIRLIKAKLQEKFNAYKTDTIKKNCIPTNDGGRWGKGLLKDPLNKFDKTYDFLMEKIAASVPDVCCDDDSANMRSRALVNVAKAMAKFIIITIACYGAFFWPLWDPLSTGVKNYFSKRSLIIQNRRDRRYNFPLDFVLITINAVLFLFLAVVGFIGTLLWWMYCVSLNTLGFMFQDPLYSSFSNLVEIINFFVLKNAENEKGDHDSREENLYQTTALIIATSFLWFLPWMAFLFPMCFIIHVVQSLVKSAFITCAQDQPGLHKSDDAIKIENKKYEEDEIRRVLHILKRNEIILEAEPGLSKSIIRGYYSLLSFPKSLINCIYRCNKLSHEYPNDEDKTKYIFVEFGAWEYNGSDNLWTSILLEIWKAIEKEYGQSRLKKYRTSIELERYYRTEKIASDSTKSTYLRRKEKGDQFQLQNIFSGLFFVVTTVMTTYIKVKGDIDLYLVLVIIGVGLLPITRQLYIYFMYILPNLWLLQVDDKASLKREQFLSGTGYSGMVKDEFEYILDFLKYTPFYIDEQNKKGKCRPHLCIFVDDLDRCNGNTVMRVLEATILLLKDSPVTCWLAVDTRLIVATIETEKGSILDKAGVTGYDFMEKIVEIPFCIPQLGNDQKFNYISRLFLQGQLDPVQLLHVVHQLEKNMIHNRVATQVCHFKDNNESRVGHEDIGENKSLRALINGMKAVVAGQSSGSFKSKLVKNSEGLVMKLENSMNEKTDINEKDKEDFFYLVSEWIEWAQNIAINPEKYDSIREETVSVNVEKNIKVGKSETTDEEMFPLIVVEGKPSGRDIDTKYFDEESQTINVREQIVAPFQIMVNPEEKKWFQQYTKYIDGTPRRMTRISNIYNIARYLVHTAYPGAKDDNFIKKLLKITILCEQWPYRMSLFIHLAEGNLRESLLQIRKISDPSPICYKLQNLELIVLKKNTNNRYDDTFNSIPKDKKKKMNDKTENIRENMKHFFINNSINDEKKKINNGSIITQRNMDNLTINNPSDDDALLAIDNFVERIPSNSDELNQDANFIKKLESLCSEMKKSFCYWKEEGNTPEITEWKNFFLKTMKKDLDKNHAGKYIQRFHNDLVTENRRLTKHIQVELEKQLKDHFSHSSLFDICCQVEDVIHQIPDDQNTNTFSRDGDYRILQQLLIEDSEDDASILKIIDIVLPHQFTIQENNEYKSLRPFMINIPRYMIECTSRLNLNLKDKIKQRSEVKAKLMMEKLLSGW